MWTRAQGRFGHSQGCNGVAAGKWWDHWHGSQFFTFFSISLSMFGHQTKLLARLFIRDARGWPSCNSSRIFARPACGTITQLPQRTHPLWALRSFHCSWYGFSVSSSVSCHPDKIIWRTFDKIISLLVHCLICTDVTGIELTMSMRKIVSPGVGTWAGDSGNSNRLELSAFPWARPGLYSIW